MCDQTHLCVVSGQFDCVLWKRAVFFCIIIRSFVAQVRNGHNSNHNSDQIRIITIRCAHAVIFNASGKWEYGFRELARFGDERVKPKNYLVEWMLNFINNTFFKWVKRYNRCTGCTGLKNKFK